MKEIGGRKDESRELGAGSQLAIKDQIAIITKSDPGTEQTNKVITVQVSDTTMLKKEIRLINKYILK